MSIVTCHTEGCENEGIGIPMNLENVDVDTGEVTQITSVVCGPCGQPITDITDAEEES